MEKQAVYESIRAFSRRGILFERQLRMLVARGKVPGVRTARGFKINVGQFLAKLENISNRSRIDLYPSGENLTALRKMGCGLVIKNEDGTVTAYAMGSRPTQDITIQAAIVEVTE